MRAVNCEQNTPAWLHWRTGRLTSSRMADILAKPKRGTAELACKRDYRMEKLCERLTGRAAEHVVTRAMDWGIQQEQFARSAYEVMANTMVDTEGLVLHPIMDFASASPDGLVDSDGCIEIKCPNTETHLEWREAGVVPEEHIPQMMWMMACCERDWCEFISFDPRLPQGLRFFMARLERDDKRIAEMEYEVIQFSAEIDDKIDRLGAPPWIPKLPAHFGDQGTERIGGVDVPADISEMLEGEICP